MKTKLLQYLLTLVFLVWFIPLEGKRLLPAWFDSNLIQWSSVGVLAFLCPIGALLSMSLLVGQHRRDGYFCFIGFALPVLFCFFMWGVSPVFFANGAVFMQPQYKEFDAIAKLVERARDSNESPETRVKAASGVYKMWGVVPVLLAADGRMVAYTPTIEDKHSRQESLAFRATAEKNLAICLWQLKQTPWLFVSFLCTSATVFIIGLGFYAFRRPREVA
jgi:hypothetical protein